MRFLCALLTLFFMTGGFAFGQDDEEDKPPMPIRTANQYFGAEDFYYLDKSGKRIQLGVDQSKITVQFVRNTDKGSYEKILREFGLSAKDWRRLTVNFGAAEIRRTVYSSAEVFIIQLPANFKGLELVNKLLERKEVFDASPVFKLNGELVYPAGIWVSYKYSTQRERDSLQQKLIAQAYLPFWGEYGYARPDGISTRINYFRRNGKFYTNPLRLSRLISQDILAVWSVPDFVPIRQPIEITAELGRPSGTMNSKFEAKYSIIYDPKKIIIDIDALTGTEPTSLKPRSMSDGLFRAEALRLESSSGRIVIRFAFKMYDTGSFELTPLTVRYNYAGAASGVPPESAIANPLFVKISGLVPRDVEGKPLVKDIFGLKRMEVFRPPMPDMPKAEDYPPSDYRFYMKSVHMKYPMLGARLMFASYIIFIVLVLYGAAFFGNWFCRKAVKRWNTKESEFERTSKACIKALQKNTATKEDTDAVLRSARRCVREILQAPDGKTVYEMIEECSADRKEILSQLLSLLDEFSRTELLRSEDISKIRVLVRKLRKGRTWTS